MKSTKFISTLLFVFLLVFVSCQKDDDNSNGNQQQETIPDTFSEYFGNEISRDFLGTVVDKNHNPIEGATISIGNKTAMTDSNGVFIIRDADVNERFGYIKAEKLGYIHGSRSLVPSSGTNKVAIMLLKATVVGSVSSGSPDTVTTNDGSSVSFDGNFIKEDGSAYSGTVDVIMHHLDPTDDDMPVQMPGMLYAQNEDGAERMLQTLGMLAVELRGSGGEDLNLAEGSTSEIKIPVDPSLMSIAPATIPLWYFDEVNGYWKEEGEATLQSNMYVGTVSHFSFWNCDIPAEAITLCVNVTNENGDVLNNSNLTITSSTYGTREGYTNENGEVCGLVPRDETLTLNVYSYDICGNTPLHTETIGSFSSDSDITIIINDNPDIIEETVVGTFINCDGDAVTDGYVQITYGGTTFTDVVNNDGSFEVNVLRCLADNTFSIKGNDFDSLQTTNDIYYTFISPLTNIGRISACNAIDEFIIYSIDDGAVEKIYFDAYGQTFDSEIFLILDDSISPIDFILKVPREIGSYYPIEFNNGIYLSIRFMENGNNYIYNFPSSNSNITINVNKVAENTGDYFDVNFSGEISFNSGIIRNIVGSAHVKRSN